jgi:beta-galactosidase
MKDSLSKIRLDNDWYFQHGTSTYEVFQAKEISQLKNVNIPHDWSVSYPFKKEAPSLGAGGYAETGEGWYCKFFDTEKLEEDQKVYLQFDGIYMKAKVWLNGHVLGKHIYGYTPFTYDITPYLNKNGSNKLIVQVDNSGQPNSRWYSGSGITRNVWLYVKNETHIMENSLFIRTEALNGNEAIIRFDGDIQVKSKVDFEWQIVDVKKKIIVKDFQEVLATQDIYHFEQIVTLQTPKLWSLEAPNCYQLILTISVNGAVIDRLKQTFGVRTAVFKNDSGFFLNGEPIKLNGVCLHHDGGAVGAAVPILVWKRRLDKLKLMGCNAIRFTHNPPDPDLLDLCDTMGFLVLDEAFDEWGIMKAKVYGSNTDESKGYSQWFEELGEEDLSKMLYRDRNHPSIVLWSIGNEVPEQLADDGYLISERLKKIVHKIDPTRKVTQANDQIAAEPKPATDRFLNSLDVVGYNYADRWKNRAETMYEEDRIQHPDWCIIGTENTSAGYLRNDARRSSTPTRIPYYSVPVRVGKLLKYTMTHDYVAGDFMWTGVDYLGEASWPNRSQTCGVLDTCGFEKDAYYFYKSVWNRKDLFVYACPHWNLDDKPGTIVPVVSYTNCYEAELFLNGKSFGRKSYLYPAIGMTEKFGYWDDARKVVPSTDDLFLSWDVPYISGTLTIIGYDRLGNKVAEYERKTAAEPNGIQLKVYDEENIKLKDGVIQVEVNILDKEGNNHPTAQNKINVEISDNTELLGIDNGQPDRHEAFTNRESKTFAGKALILIRPLVKGEITLKVTSPNLLDSKVNIKVR